MDSLSFFIFGYSTVILDAVTVPPFVIGTILFLFLSYYLVSKSYQAILREAYEIVKLVDNGVYALVRHPMYLGILLSYLSFLFLILSVIAALIWIIFYFIYDKMATYEEKKLIEKLGEKYRLYPKKVSKWFYPK